MKRRWIVLILIPIAAIVSVFAWSIAPVYALLAVIVVLILGIAVMILVTGFRSSSQDADKNNHAVSSRSNNYPEKKRNKADRTRSTGVLPPTPALEPQEPKSVLSEEWDEAEEEFLDQDLDDEIALPPRQVIPNPASPVPGASVGSTARGDEDTFEEEDIPVRYSGGISLREPSIEDAEDALIDEKKKDSKEEKTELPETDKTTEAQFTAYYARQTVAKTEYGFYVYAHLPEALISADIEQFREYLGGGVPKPAIATQTTTLEQGAILTAMVQCDALEFTQIGIMKKWQAPFVRFDFRYTAPESLVDEFVEGRIAIMLGMIEIASIDFQTLITAPQPINLINSVPDNPLTQEIFKLTHPASMYQKIFISYSRKDTVIAEQYRKAQIMAGNIIFMDTHTIRAGEDWEEALKRFIREADVFQLFWSEHSAASEHVKFEWDYALNQRCSETRCIGFIRPAYWEQPLITPPPELGHLHFAYVPQDGILS